MDTIEHKDRLFTVSVVIPAYNIAEFVGRAIDSVLAQTHKPDEIIVVDDGSGDNTAEVIKSYGIKVHYIYQKNAGLSAARNTGIKAAMSEWIALLDGDDNWLPDHLKSQISILKSNANLIWCTGNCEYCLPSEDRRSPYLKPERARQLLGRKDYFDSFFDAFRSDASGNSNTMIIKRSVLLEAGLFQESLRFAEDWDMWMRIAYRYPEIGYVTKPVAVYYINRSGSLKDITTDQEKIRVNSQIIDQHLVISAEFGKNREFELCATFMLRRWIRGMLFHNLPDDIRDILTRYDSLLPNYYKMFMKLLMRFPKTTADMCHLISRIIRCFNLRRRVVCHPQR